MTHVKASIELASIDHGEFGANYSPKQRDFWERGE
jgi:hypothetical protein